LILGIPHLMYINIDSVELFLDKNVIDTLGMKISLWFAVGFFFIINIIQVFFILLRIDKQPLKGKGIHILFLFLFGQTACYYILNIRISTDRLSFSCIIYTLIQFTGIHSKILFNFSIIYTFYITIYQNYFFKLFTKN
jgi:hypothetical protein